MEYSGQIQDGWNKNGTYNRLQYSNNVSSINEINDILNEALKVFKESGRSRLDIRLSTKDIVESDVKNLKDKFQDLEISALHEVKNPRNIQSLIICKNSDERKIGNQAILQIQDDVSKRINKYTSESIEPIAINAFDNFKNNGFSFETDYFTSEELLNLWGENFGWNLEQCKQYENNDKENEKVFGIRDENGKLCAAIFISGNETTEWAVEKDKQKHGLITPLLIYSHVWWVNNKVDEVLHVFSRYNRSLSPGLRTGIEVSEINKKGILTNHVVVGEDEKAEPENKNKPFFGDIDGSKLRSFVIGQLNPQKITPKIQDIYFNN